MEVPVYLSPSEVVWRVARPDFLHFTHRANLPAILASGSLGGDFKPVRAGNGEYWHSKVYAYCLDLAMQFHSCLTMPRRILEQPEEYVAIVFSSDHALWWHYPEESATSWDAEQECERAIPLIDPLILSVAEGLTWLGATPELVSAQEEAA